jgi:hypothetical protein
MRKSLANIVVGLLVVLTPLIAFGLDPDLVLFLPFEEGAGNTTKDMSGNGNDGELVGGVAWTGSGKFGNALEFNGTDSQVVLPGSGKLQPDDSDFSIEAWIKADPGSQGWARVVDKFYGTGYCLGRVGSELTIGAEFGGNANDFGSTTPVFDNEWHHVALVRDVKSAEGLKISQLMIYVDGVQENDTIAPNADVHNLDTTSVRVGAGVNCCAEDAEIALFYKGIIDEVLIYRKALTEDEIKRDMNASPVVAAVAYSGKVTTTWADLKSR